MLKKLVCGFCLVIACLVGFSAFEENPVYAADFNLVYNIDEKTSYSAPDENNVVKVQMVKPNYVEEYWIQYYKDWFVVRNVSCEHICHMEELFEELYARQYYGPNPRVTSVRNALLAKGAFKQPLANSYKDMKVSTEDTATIYITQFLEVSKELGNRIKKYGPIVVEKKISDMDGVAYYYVNVMQHPSDGNGILAKFQINQFGEIFYFDTSKEDYINVDDQFVIE